MTSASTCFEIRSAVRCRVPVSTEWMVGSGIIWTLAQVIVVAVTVYQDCAVHLCHLVEHGRAVVDVEPDSAGKHEGEVLCFADDNQSAGTGMDNVVDAFAELGTRCDRVYGTEQPGILTL